MHLDIGHCDNCSLFSVVTELVLKLCFTDKLQEDRSTNPWLTPMLVFKISVAASATYHTLTALPVIKSTMPCAAGRLSPSNFCKLFLFPHSAYAERSLLQLGQLGSKIWGGGVSNLFTFQESKSPFSSPPTHICTHTCTQTKISENRYLQFNAGFCSFLFSPLKTALPNKHHSQ